MDKPFTYDPLLLKNIYLALVTNSDITSTIPQLTQIIDEFRETLPNLQALQDGKKDTIKNPIQNNDSRNSFCLLEKIMGALNDYAVMSENAELLSFVSFIKDCSLVPGDTNFKKNITLIIEYAHRYMFAIERFGVKKHHLIEFELEIGSCEKYNLLNEKELNEKLHSILQRIDHLIELLKVKYPRFYNEYQMSKLTPSKSYSYENLSTW